MIWKLDSKLALNIGSCTNHRDRNKNMLCSENRRLGGMPAKLLSCKRVSVEILWIIRQLIMIKQLMVLCFRVTIVLAIFFSPVIFQCSLFFYVNNGNSVSVFLMGEDRFRAWPIEKDEFAKVGYPCDPDKQKIVQ